MERIYNNILVGILPIYKKDIGDCTKIILGGQESFILDYRIDRVIKSLANYYIINLRELKKIYSRYINAKNLIPITFDQENIFIPIKTRIPILKNDKAFSYINLNSIDLVRPEGNKTNIILKDGRLIVSLSNIGTVRKHINHGNIINKCFVKRRMKSYARDKEDYLLAPSNQEDLNKLLELITILKNS